MNSVAEKIIPIHTDINADMRECTVIAVEPGVSVLLNINGKMVQAKRAFSCLVDPEAGDIVLCSENRGATAYVLAILARPTSQKTRMSFPGDTDIQVNRGGLNIHSSDTVSLAAQNVNFFSNRVIHKSDEAIIAYEKITAKGKELHANYTTVRLISELINTMARQVIDRFKGYIRSTEDHDMVKAGQITRTAKGLHAMDAEHTILNSKKCTKIDGEKILMG